MNNDMIAEVRADLLKTLVRQQHLQGAVFQTNG